MEVPEALISSKYPHSEVECPACGKGFNKDSTITYVTHYKTEHVDNSVLALEEEKEFDKTSTMLTEPTYAEQLSDWLSERIPQIYEEMNFFDGDTVSSTGGHKGVKQEAYDLIPVGPLAEVARVYGFGASKYANRNWERGYEWGKSYAALQRHVNAWWNGEEIDEESGLSHLAHAVFHLFSLMWFKDRFPQFDDRSKN